MASSSNVVQEGDQVVFKRHGLSRVLKVRKNRQVYFEKQKFHVDELIGQPYGTAYELQKGKLLKVTGNKSAESCVDANVSEPTGDNRNLQDLDSNQKMSKEDIMELRDQGLTGEEIIEELVENSETFHNKTEFSKAKYLKKKKKVHILSFTVLRPTPRLVLDIYAKEPGKICNLRADSLSQLLNYSNVCHGSNVVVVETCHGLVMASVLQRLGGKGKLIQLIPNTLSQVNRQVMDYFSFSKEEMDNVYFLPMGTFSSYKEADENSSPDNMETQTHQEVEEVKKEMPSSMEEVEKDTDMETQTHQEGEEIKKENLSSEEVEKDADMGEESSVSQKLAKIEKLDENLDADNDISKIDVNDDADGNDEAEPVSKRLLQRAAREERQKEALEIIHKKKIDSLIIACKYNPVDIVKNMLKFLPPSRNVVVYCQFIDPLVTIYTYIKENRLGIQAQLSENWLRDYQVLHQRTHPVINMSGTGGYLLTFTTCDPT